MKNLLIELPFSIIGRKLRKRVNPNKMCAKCFNEHKWQTRDGTMLCARCYSLHVKNGKR